jgi:hypothetical protein
MDEPSLAEPDRQVGFSWRTIRLQAIAVFFPTLQCRRISNGAPLGMSVSKKKA